MRCTHRFEECARPASSRRYTQGGCTYMPRCQEGCLARYLQTYTSYWQEASRAEKSRSYRFGLLPFQMSFQISGKQITGVDASSLIRAQSQRTNVEQPALCGQSTWMNRPRPGVAVRVTFNGTFAPVSPRALLLLPAPPHTIPASSASGELKRDHMSLNWALPRVVL